MRELRTSNKFEKDLVRLKKRGKQLSKLEVVVENLRLDKNLEPKHRPHLLSGNWAGYWELHLEPDWLLIYTVDELCLNLIRTGTHSDLF